MPRDARLCDTWALAVILQSPLLTKSHGWGWGHRISAVKHNVLEIASNVTSHTRSFEWHTIQILADLISVSLVELNIRSRSSTNAHLKQCINLLFDRTCFYSSRVVVFVSTNQSVSATVITRPETALFNSFLAAGRTIMVAVRSAIWVAALVVRVPQTPSESGSAGGPGSD